MDIYKLTIDDETGMEAISLVEFPATEQNFLAFSDDTLWKFNQEQRCVTGVVMLADTPIYRYQNGKEFYIMFDSETIKKMMIKYSKDGLMNSLNIEHKGAKIDGVFLYESYIYNSDKGIKPNDFNVTDGSWIASFKVENDEIWEKIKNGEVKGFSLEGYFNLQPVDEFDNWLDSYLK